MPMSQPEHAVTPQPSRLKPGEILADEVQHSDRAVGHHRLGLGSKRIAVILERYLATGFDRQHIRRQTFDELEHRFGASFKGGSAQACVARSSVLRWWE